MIIIDNYKMNTKSDFFDFGLEIKDRFVLLILL